MQTMNNSYGIDPNHPALLGSLTPPPNRHSSKIHNFSPGPTSLPSSVEATIARRCFPAARLGSMALSHRSPEFSSILSQTVSNIRRVMHIPDEYEVLFTQGGGHGQFSAVPLNLCPSQDCPATYVVSGTWSLRAIAEARKYCTPHVISSQDAEGNFTTFPMQEMLTKYHPESRFIYLCSNETVNGIEVHRLPTFSAEERLTMPPLVVDASSDFTTKPITWRESNVGVLFACASKNIGHAGITCVVIRRDLLGEANPFTPGFLDYKLNIEAGNVWNTIPTFNVDVIGCVMDWILEEGGINVMEDKSVEKAEMVYGCIEDSEGFYGTPLDTCSDFRSRMNVPFCVAGGDEGLTNLFLVECWKRGIVGLRTVTPFKQGIYLRASLYHGVSCEDVKVLVNYMKQFAAMYGTAVISNEEEKETISLEEPVSPLSSCADISRLSSSPTGVIDMAYTLPKNFKASSYAKLSADMFAPPNFEVEAPVVLR